ncbi:hypothetical protein ACIPEN_03225 [Herbaspirillum chlorophenolicum]|uniref:Uncharacterized protein n=1 Tax=Herbaspirillum chlorophenolicum TaxID=211589 RepID=A0ABW8EWY2_9BURK
MMVSARYAILVIDDGKRRSFWMDGSAIPLASGWPHSGLEWKI